MREQMPDVFTEMLDVQTIGQGGHITHAGEHADCGITVLIQSCGREKVVMVSVLYRFIEDGAVQMPEPDFIEDD